MALSALPARRLRFAGPAPGPSFAVILLPLFAATVALPLWSAGVLTGAHAIALALCPIWARTARDNPVLSRLWIFAVLWVAAQAVSNLWHGTELLSSFAIAGLLIVALASAMLWLTDYTQVRVPTVTLFFGLGWAALTVLTAGEGLAINPWKFGLASSVSVVALSLAYLIGGRKLVLVTLLLLVAVSLYFDTRSQAAFGALAFAMLVLSGRTMTRRRPRRLLVALIGTSAALILLYPTLASSGVLGDRAQIQQEQFDAIDANYLAGARMELPQAAYLVAVNPLLGIGVNRHLDTSEAYAALHFAERIGYTASPAHRQYLLGQDRLLGYAQHSLALDTAVFAGVLALPFWLSLAWHTAKELTRLRSPDVPAAGLFVFMGISGVFDMLFSPMTAGTLLAIALLAFLAACYARLSDEGPPAQQ